MMRFVGLTGTPADWQVAPRLSALLQLAELTRQPALSTLRPINLIDD
jgi:hypothetical protein